MNLPTPEAGLVGGLLRLAEGFASAAPTLLVGLLIAGIFRYYFPAAGIRRLFGGESLRSIPQSWAVGMLLPVCSIGVLPILMEMRRAKVKPGALSAFALSAPLFNPLSLLYGLTLSRPSIVVMFAAGSLLVVTLVGILWDRLGTRARAAATPADALDGPSGASRASEAVVGEDATGDQPPMIGVRRLAGVLITMTRQLAGPVGGWSLVALSGLVVLSVLLPFGAMQHSVERDDGWAPATMTAVAIPAYATPMLAMSQLGMMFQHANSPGAAFALLVLGTGVNLATIVWLGRTFGRRNVGVWFTALVGIVLAIACLINRPLLPVGVEPAGHTHAFDIYTNPIASPDAMQWSWLRTHLAENIDLGEAVALAMVAGVFVLGCLARLARIDESRLLARDTDETSWPDEPLPTASWDRVVSPTVVGAVMIAGLVAISVVMCYGYYPPPRDVLEEIAVARAECLSAANAGQVEHAAHWLEIWDDWSRRLEVGTFLRTGELRPYQRVQGHLIRKKLELLEHELEHDPFELDVTRQVVREILATNRRWVQAFRPAAG